MSRAAAPVVVMIAAIVSACSVFNDPPDLRLALVPNLALSPDAIAADIESDFGGRAPIVGLESRLEEIANLMASGLGYDAQDPFETVVLDEATPMMFRSPGRRLFVTRGMAAMFGDDHEAAAAMGLVLAAPFGLGLERLYAQPADSGVNGLVRLFPADTQIGARVRRLVAPYLSPDGATDRIGEVGRVASAMLSRGFDPDGLVRLVGVAQLSADAMLALTGGLPSLSPAAAFPIRVDVAAAAVADARQARETRFSAAARREVEPQPVLLPGLMDGLAVGPGPQGAALRDGVLVHPGLGVSLVAPPGSTTISAPSMLRIITPSGAHVMIEGFANAPPTDHLIAYIRDRPGRALAVTGRLRDALGYRIGPFDAATAQAVILAASGGAGLSLTALRQTRDSQLYEVTAIWSMDNERARVEAAAMTSSLRVATEPNRPAALALQTAPAPVGRALGASSVAWFALINGLPVGADPAPGATVKAIVAR